MIANDLQYRVTRSQAEGLARALADFDDRPEAHSGTDPLMIPVIRAGIESQLGTLRGEMARYDALKRGDLRAEALAPLAGIFFVGRRLIEARIAAGLAESELAARARLTPAQVQHYEATEYEAASLSQLQEVAEVLRLELADTSVTPMEDELNVAARAESAAEVPAKSHVGRRKRLSDATAKHRRAGRR